MKGRLFRRVTKDLEITSRTSTRLADGSGERPASTPLDNEDRRPGDFTARSGSRLVVDRVYSIRFAAPDQRWRVHARQRAVRSGRPHVLRKGTGSIEERPIAITMAGTPTDTQPWVQTVGHTPRRRPVTLDPSAVREFRSLRDSGRARRAATMQPCPNRAAPRDRMPSGGEYLRGREWCWASWKGRVHGRIGTSCSATPVAGSA